ncbi:dihydrolipoamide dehydrogenase [Streptomyces sp. SceaMP-e96]|uniref:dihydrolipoyl dehydrogenase n=1 Tax=unclassified Streptomyces TaxID=2593676 RepID=UPI000823B8A0|nr:MULTISPECIES: dihydrolipoyl dehydrogenase [unclassified Streptomyces]MYT18448.1 dihydrolipoyl dehydrogenase [Streptomyces sp. SID4951]SCK56808.1 dihydrolipoamide dehydrogenase [Streptomyces sp. SceaMP-e96]
MTPVKPLNQHFDVLVIGGGPGGYVAAIRAAQLGRTVALVDKERLGGVCLNWGCIPTKAMLRSAEVLETVRGAEEFGVLAEGVRLDYSAVLKRKDGIVSRLTDGIAHLLKANGVTVVNGHARFTDPHTVAVHESGPSPLGEDGPLYATPPTPQPARETLSADDIIIATGSQPLMPDLPGSDLPGVITSDGAFLLPEVPARAVVVGGSAVGAEWASLFRTFGAEVTLVEMAPTLLPAEDAEIGRTLTRSFTKQGIKVLTRHTVTAIEGQGEGDGEGEGEGEGEGDGVQLRALVTDANGQPVETLPADIVLFGVGRRPNTAGLDLEKAGVHTDDRGYIPVTDRLRTNIPHISAIGDVTGRIQLAHVASHQALVAASVVSGHDERIDYRAVPAATFTRPEVASVGLTEAQAREAGHETTTARFPFAALGRAHAYGATDGMVKVVADRSSGAVLGTHIIGPGASDLIAEAALAVTHGLTLTGLADTIHAHPTLGEATMEAAMGALGLPLHTAPVRRRG